MSLTGDRDRYRKAPYGFCNLSCLTDLSIIFILGHVIIWDHNFTSITYWLYIIFTYLIKILEYTSKLLAIYDHSILIFFNGVIVISSMCKNIFLSKLILTSQ